MKLSHGKFAWLFGFNKADCSLLYLLLLKGCISIVAVFFISKKIRKKGNRKYGYWYAVYLRNTAFPGTSFICNIKKAIAAKEIIIQ